MITQSLLDLDGVLSDFLSLALKKLNYELDEPVAPLTPESYSVIGKFNIAEVYGLSMTEFWETIERGDRFWCNIEPFPWAKDLYEWLATVAPVTICTSPSHHIQCAGQKVEWVKRHLGLENSHMMIGGRKYLMAKPEHLLIDDYLKNVSEFTTAGGSAVQVPSNWNTNPLTYEAVRHVIERRLNE